MSRKTNLVVLTLFLAACCAMALEASFQKKLVLVPSGTPPSDWSALPEVEPLLTVPSFPGDVSLRGVTWGEQFTDVVPEGYTLLSVVMQEFRWKVNGSIAQGIQYGVSQASFGPTTPGMSMNGTNTVSCETCYSVNLFDSDFNIVNMATPWTEVGSTSIVFSDGQAFDSLACLGTTSDTDTPGNPETAVVAVGYQDGKGVTVRALDEGGAPMPLGSVTWSCSGGSITPNGSAAVVDTSASGMATVTATSGNTAVSLKVQVIGVSALQARRKGLTWAYGSSATIASGGKNSDVHKAELQIQLSPVPVKQATLHFQASLSGAAAHQGTNVPAVLSCGGSSLSGDGAGTLDVSSWDSSTGLASAELRSGNVTRTCTVTLGGESASVTMAMASLGNREFDWPVYFIYGSSFDISFYPTLQEAADEDGDQDGIFGEGAIAGHDMHFYVSSIDISYWKIDWSTGQYVECGMDHISAGIREDPIVRYGLRISDLMDFGSASESMPGKYTDSETVYGHYDFDVSTLVETCIEVESFRFSVYDGDVFKY